MPLAKVRLNVPSRAPDGQINICYKCCYKITNARLATGCNRSLYFVQVTVPPRPPATPQALELKNSLVPQGLTRVVLLQILLQKHLTRMARRETG